MHVGAGDYYFVETGNLLLKKGLIVCPKSGIPNSVANGTATATATRVNTISSSTGLTNSGHALSTRLMLFLSCTLFPAALI
jgi:hypothetical protein